MNFADIKSVPRNESYLQPPASPDKDGALKSLRHMSTIEMMTTAIKYSKLEQFGDSPLDTVAEDEVVQLRVPETKRWKRTLIRVRVCMSILWEEVSRIIGRQIPRSLDSNRLGIQWTVALLLSTIPLYIEAVSSRLQGAGVYIAINAVQMYEATHGGSFNKVADRGLATIISYAGALTVYLPIYLKGFRLLSENEWLRWTFYASAVAATGLWGFVRFHFGKAHQTLVYGGLSASIGFYAMVTEEWFWSMARIVGTTMAGIAVGSIVFRYVLPQSAAACAQADLAQSLRLISRSLEPLLVFESGVVNSSSFFEKSMRPTRVFSKRLSSFRDIPVFRRASKFQTPFEQREVDYQIFKQFRDQVWNSVESTYKLLKRQDLLTRNARKEFYARKPHRFPADKYEALVRSVHKLFFCATALYLGLDTRTAAVSSSSDRELFGDTWQVCGAVKLLRKKSSLTEIEQARSHPAGFNHLLARSRAELNLIRAKFASDPRLLDPGPTLGSPPAFGSPPILQEHEPPPPLSRDYSALAVGDPSPLTSSLSIGYTRMHISKEISKSKHTEVLSLTSRSPHPSLTPQEAPGRNLLKDTSDAMVTDPRQIRFDKRTATFQVSLSPLKVGRPKSRQGSVSPGLRGGDQLGKAGWSIESSEACEGSGAKVDELTAVCQWVSVYGPLIGRVSRHVCAAIDSVARSLETRKLCASVQDALLMAEDAVTDFSRQRRHLQSSLHNLCDELLLDEAERSEAAEFLLRQWMGIGSKDYDNLSREQRAHVWETFGSMQDRLSTTRAAIFGLTSQLQSVADSLRSFMRAMLLPSEDKRAKAI